MTTWQMVIEVEREIAVQRAARLGTLGAAPRRSSRIMNSLRRRARPATAAPPPATARLPVSEGGA